MREVPSNRISEKALKVWRISAAISTLFIWLLFLVFVGLTFIFDWSIWITLGIAVALLIFSYLRIWNLPKWKWQRWRYEVNEEEIDLMRGLWVVERTLIPMVRVQHVDTEQGPLLRKYGLATVTISTAATVHEIPALAMSEAEELRDRISTLARVAREDV